MPKNPLDLSFSAKWCIPLQNEIISGSKAQLINYIQDQQLDFEIEDFTFEELRIKTLDTICPHFVNRRAWLKNPTGITPKINPEGISLFIIKRFFQHG